MIRIGHGEDLSDWTPRRLDPAMNQKPLYARIALERAEADMDDLIEALRMLRARNMVTCIDYCHNWLYGHANFLGSTTWYDNIEDISTELHEIELDPDIHEFFNEPWPNGHKYDTWANHVRTGEDVYREYKQLRDQIKYRGVTGQILLPDPYLTFRGNYFIPSRIPASYKTSDMIGGKHSSGSPWVRDSKGIGPYVNQERQNIQNYKAMNGLDMKVTELTIGVTNDVRFQQDFGKAYVNMCVTYGFDPWFWKGLVYLQPFENVQDVLDASNYNPDLIPDGPSPPPECSCGPWINGECVNVSPWERRWQTRTCTPSGCDIETRIIVDSTCQPTPTPCTCTPWVNRECVNNTQRKQVRTCTPSGCNSEVRLVFDAACQPTPTPEPTDEEKLNEAIAYLALILAALKKD